MSKRRRRYLSRLVAREQGVLFPSPELWLPGHSLRGLSPAARFLADSPYHGNPTCYCPDPCATCTCEQCAAASPFYAPCCWRVVIAGIVDGSCSDCEVLNKTYYLSQDTPGGCTWSEGAVCGECNPTDIILTVTLDGSDYIITVTMDGHIWEKNYGTSKPECCGLTNETIPHTTNTGDCDTSSATCVITALADGNACDTDPCLLDCSGRCDNRWESIAIDLGSSGWTDDKCDGCDELWDVWVTGDSGPGCGSEYLQLDWCFGNFRFIPNESTYFWLTLAVGVTGALRFWQVRLRVNDIDANTYAQALWTSATWDSTENPDCRALADIDGKIELSLTSDSPDRASISAFCIGTAPSTIYIFDANA